jgi:hypothetical protein
MSTIAAWVIAAGLYHADEIPHAGGAAQCLFRGQGPGDDVVAPCEVIIKPVSDPGADFPNVEVELPDHALVAFDLPGIPNGPVRTPPAAEFPIPLRVAGDPEHHQPASTATVTWADTGHTFTFELDPATAELVIVHQQRGPQGHHTERIGERTGCDDCHPSILWAGDLDADGDLDVIADLSQHYNVNHLTVLIGHTTEAGLFRLREAAALTSYGC